MPSRFEYERAIRASDLPSLARLTALTLATWADAKTGVIPDRMMPSLTTLEAATGMSRGAVRKHLDRLEEDGWVERKRPSVAAARSKKARTRYRLLIPRGTVVPDSPENELGHEKTETRAPHALEPSVNGSGLGHEVPQARARDALALGHEVTPSRARGALKSSLSTCSTDECLPADGRRPSTGSGADCAGGSAAPQDHDARLNASAADIRTVVAGLPPALRAALAAKSRFTPPMLTRVVAAELDRGLTPARLITRATDRWHLRGYADAEIRRPVGVAHALLANDCTSPRCDDGTDLDTGTTCRTCQRAREDHRANQETA